mmetsp:Transcript_113179/g.320341  ORF Transcript_113179/g.320341 Transcript_113179/m.320341 type:complete len:230 (+) Transcript_113179:652-1341(+)
MHACGDTGARFRESRQIDHRKEFPQEDRPPNCKRPAGGGEEANHRTSVFRHNLRTAIEATRNGIGNGTYHPHAGEGCLPRGREGDPSTPESVDDATQCIRAESQCRNLRDELRPRRKGSTFSFYIRGWGLRRGRRHVAGRGPAAQVRGGLASSPPRSTQNVRITMATCWPLGCDCMQIESRRHTPDGGHKKARCHQGPSVPESAERALLRGGAVPATRRCHCSRSCCAL